jgi:hypothetical protein
MLAKNVYIRHQKQEKTMTILEKIYEKCHRHPLLWMTLGAVGTAVVYHLKGFAQSQENRDLRVKNSMYQRRIKHLENKSDSNLMRGIRIGREMSNKKD